MFSKLCPISVLPDKPLKKPRHSYFVRLLEEADAATRTPEIPTDTSEIPESATPEIPESATPEIPESATPEIPESATPEIPETPDLPPETPEVPRLETTGKKYFNRMVLNTVFDGVIKLNDIKCRTCHY